MLDDAHRYARARKVPRSVGSMHSATKLTSLLARRLLAAPGPAAAAATCRAAASLGGGGDAAAVVVLGGGATAMYHCVILGSSADSDARGTVVAIGSGRPPWRSQDPGSANACELRAADRNSEVDATATDWPRMVLLVFGA